MAALAGSWIGGGANFIAIGSAVGATSTMLGMMVIVDVLSSNIWRGIVFFLAGKARKLLIIILKPTLHQLINLLIKL